MRFTLAILGMCLAFLLGGFVEHDFGLVNIGQASLVKCGVTKPKLCCGCDCCKKCPCDKCGCCNACIGQNGDEKCTCPEGDCQCCPKCPGHK